MEFSAGLNLQIVSKKYLDQLNSGSCTGELICSADGSSSAALLHALSAAYVYAAALSFMLVSCTSTSDRLQSLLNRDTHGVCSFFCTARRF